MSHNKAHEHHEQHGGYLLAKKEGDHHNVYPKEKDGFQNNTAKVRRKQEAVQSCEGRCRE